MEQPRKRGRPATGQTPKRNVRIGYTWDQAEELAERLGMSMTAYVEEALRRENRRVGSRVLTQIADAAMRSVE